MLSGLQMIQEDKVESLWWHGKFAQGAGNEVF